MTHRALSDRIADLLRRLRCRDARLQPAVPAPATPAGRAHGPASARTIRAHLTGLPDWMVDECVAWVGTREARSHQFVDGHAAAIHWLDHAQRVLPTLRTDAQEPS